MWVVNVYAADTSNGYVLSTYGSAVKSFYGECVHTAYYNPEADSRAECDGQKIASAPISRRTKVETIIISDAGTVLFDFNSATLTLEGIDKLTAFAKKLSEERDITSIAINGYTDSIGKSDYNLELATKRADAVKQFFIQNGFLSSLITTHGYGEQDAKASGTCIIKYGNDDMEQIWQLENMLNSKNYGIMGTIKEKKQLQNKLHELKVRHNDLINCTASDRRVVFTIEHTKQVENTATDNVSLPIDEKIAESSAQ